jgi:hypothetical protein
LRALNLELFTKSSVNRLFTSTSGDDINAEHTKLIRKHKRKMTACGPAVKP